MNTLNLHDNARSLLERYLGRVRDTFGSRDQADHEADEITEDVRQHVFDTLATRSEPISAASMQRVLDELGNPHDWTERCADSGIARSRRRLTIEATLPRTSVAPRRDDWHLAYVSLALLLLAFAVPPLLWILTFGAFLTARASAHADAIAQPRERASQAFLRNPSLLFVYVPLVMVLLLWPAAVVRFGADYLVDHRVFATRFGVEFSWIAERIATIRLTNFDPSRTLDSAVRNGHWLIFPVGCWLIVLAAIVRLAPRPSAALFHPFLGRSPRTLAGMLLFCGLLLVASALALVLLKHSLPHDAVVRHTMVGSGVLAQRG
ncbi:MAG: hypothetical protein H6834_00800 [Planctomycetes bacterium]|nr:hypothetical protein [Planctomycetota bacterium]